MHTERRAMAQEMKRRQPQLSAQEIAWSLRMTPSLVMEALGQPWGPGAVQRLWDPNKSLAQIAKEAGVSRKTVWRWQKPMGEIRQLRLNQEEKAEIAAMLRDGRNTTEISDQIGCSMKSARYVRQRMQRTAA